MTPWTLLDTAQVPGQHGAASALRLYRRGEEFSIKAGNCELMNSRVHGSEDALAELGCGRIAGRARARVLIGGLGMGYTLAAALQQLSNDADVVVAELVPAVVVWNRGALAHLAGQPLSDTRVTVREQDVGEVMRAASNAFDAILLDVDNGPEGLTRKANDWLYGLDGLDAAYAALRPGGVLAVWSAGAEPVFTQRLHKIGFAVEEVRVRAHGGKQGARHMVWLASRPDLRF
ncbi:MAG: spermidine synthase [Gammaproteobacteria bacterium]|nr:spermidine synthase [Gammaproteobacteria bacterium]